MMVEAWGFSVQLAVSCRHSQSKNPARGDGHIGVYRELPNRRWEGPYPEVIEELAFWAVEQAGSRSCWIDGLLRDLWITASLTWSTMAACSMNSKNLHAMYTFVIRLLNQNRPKRCDTFREGRLE